MMSLFPPQSVTIPPAPHGALVIHPSLLQQMRLRLLDELTRLTAAEVDCGNLGVRLSGACLHGLHLGLQAGTPAEVADWMIMVTALLHEAAGYLTPLQERLAWS